MKTIKLRGKYAKGKRAIIDENRYLWMINQKWYMNPNGYIFRGVYDPKVKRSKIRLMHYDVLKDNPVEGFEVDHINGIRHDNRKENLRFVTPSKNNRANKIRSSKFGRGVCKANTRKMRFQASIYVKGKRFLLGAFEKAKDAAKLYKQVQELVIHIEK